MTQGRYYFRFNLYHRILHGMVIVSFLGLAVTGLPLKYAQTGWGLWLSHALGGPFTAGYLHRFFAIITFTYFALHLGYIARLVLPAARESSGDPTPWCPSPATSCSSASTSATSSGSGPRPRFGRWAYWEKFDYWAVFWGVSIIGASRGSCCGSRRSSRATCPGWIFNVAILVHSDEALLAVGFIFTIHFFNGHLRPEKFPMDPVIFTGRVEEEEFRQDHPEEYDRLRAEGRLDVPPCRPAAALAAQLLPRRGPELAGRGARPDLADHHHGAQVIRRGPNWATSLSACAAPPGSRGARFGGQVTRRARPVRRLRASRTGCRKAIAGLCRPGLTRQPIQRD